MIDEDLDALHSMLRQMEPRQKLSIGHRFVCSAGELLWVIEEALSARRQAKATGQYEAFQPSHSRSPSP